MPKESCATMQNGLYVALSAQVSLQRRLDTIAANVANMNTPGYRAEGVTFAEQVARAGRTAFLTSARVKTISRAKPAL